MKTFSIIPFQTLPLTVGGGLFLFEEIVGLTASQFSEEYI